jgi:hypothetical protein
VTDPVSLHSVPRGMFLSSLPLCSVPAYSFAGCLQVLWNDSKGDEHLRQSNW